MNAADDTTASVLTFNSATTLAAVLDAIAAQHRPPARTVIVDNASTDDTPDLLSDLPPDHHPIRLPTNRGVGAGHATGWSEALTDPAVRFVWVLEHDTYPEPDCLHALRSTALAGGRHIGAVTSQLGGNAQETAASRRDNTAIPVENLTFNSVLLTREAIESVGLPREDLFVGGEDRDYSRRLRQAGFAVVRQRGAVAVHPNKANRRLGIRPSPVRHYYSTRNSVRLRRESDGRLAAALLAFRIAAGAARTFAVEDHKAARLAARAVGIVDGLSGRLGERHYWFMRHNKT